MTAKVTKSAVGATSAKPAGKATKVQPSSAKSATKAKAAGSTASKPGLKASVPKSTPAKAVPKAKSKGATSNKDVASKKGAAVIEKAVKDATESAFNKVSPSVAQQELRLLCQRYPEAECELDYSSTFQLLTAVIMSAQTTDVTVNKVTKTLFARFPKAKDLAEADLDDIKEIIKPTGYYNAKATNIQNCAKALVERFGGEVPKTLDELVTLPGVGRKTANVVLGVAFGVPGWTVDTHVQRLSHRLGLTGETDPGKIEIELQKLFPNQDWSQLSITLIWHGRRTCFARNPDCPNCPINHLCPSSQV